MGRHYSNKKVVVVPPIVMLIGVQILMIATVTGVLLATFLYFLLWF